MVIECSPIMVTNAKLHHRIYNIYVYHVQDTKRAVNLKFFIQFFFFLLVISFQMKIKEEDDKFFSWNRKMIKLIKLFKKLFKIIYIKLYNYINIIIIIII